MKAETPGLIVATKPMRKRPFAKDPEPAGNAMLLGYARVSKGDEQNNSLQATALKAAGCRKLFEEAASGGRWDRPELHRMLDQLRKGDTVVVWKLLYSGKSYSLRHRRILPFDVDPATALSPRDQTSLRGRHSGRRNMGSEGRAVTSRPRRAGAARGAAVNFHSALASPSVP
ncbi:MAG: recombinase family protein [Acetobacteraceae bacterium]|nr:recombinase family protein [Acetobacteraceae bacterium]